MMDFGYHVAPLFLLVALAGCSFGVDWCCHVFDRNRTPGLTLRRPRSLEARIEP